MAYYVYILASKRNGTLYIGVTNNLIRRIYEHKETNCNEFTYRYKIHVLVYYEVIEDLFTAIEREKHLKKWKRAWKIRRIESINPTWEDLFYKLEN